MTRDEVKKVLMVIDATYPNFRIDNLSDTLDAWYFFLADHDYSKIAIALKTFVNTSGKGFAPSVDQLISLTYRTEELNQMDDMEAWVMVRKAIRNGIYGAESEYEKFPEAVKDAVGSPAMIRQWAQMDSDTIDSVVASNFQRTFRARSSRANEIRRLPVEARNMIGVSDYAKICMDDGE